MTATTQFVKATLVALTALAACALMLAYAVSYADSTYQPVSSLGFTASGTLMLRATLIVGGVVIVFFGAPAYALLYRCGRATWSYVLLVGGLPGLVALPFNWPLGLLFLVFGLPISATVRWVFGMGPNNLSGVRGLTTQSRGPP